MAETWKRIKSYDMKNLILQKLKDDFKFRERRFRLRGIMQLVVDKYGKEITNQNADDIAGDIISSDRIWRKALEDDPTIRGKDYDDKTKYEQEYQIRELGMEAGIHQQVKKMKRMVGFTEREGDRVVKFE